jgi:transcriptional regulator with XRE-family HTH domain
MAVDLNVHVGQLVRRRRLILGLSQADVAHRLGITHQQIHKYELGMSRISVDRLCQLSVALEAPLSYFLAGEGWGGASPEAELPTGNGAERPKIAKV